MEWLGQEIKFQGKTTDYHSIGQIQPNLIRKKTMPWIIELRVHWHRYHLLKLNQYNIHLIPMLSLKYPSHFTI